MMVSTPFGFTAPTDIRFGEGVSGDLAGILPDDATRVAMIRGGRGLAAEPMIAALDARDITVIDIRCPGEPSVVSVNAALDVLRGTEVDAIVACGGGAVIDSAKAIAFCHGHCLCLTDDFSKVPERHLADPPPLPVIAIPTTAGTGAEVTANAVLDVPATRAKISLRGRALIPGIALVDPTLLPSAPRSTILGSGMDAIVQTIEAFTSSAANAFSDAMTEPNIRRGLEALRTVVNEPTEAAWRDLAWVSLTSGIALANAGLGAAHGLASVVGGRYAAPHGALCGRLLIPTLRRNAAAAPPGSRAQDRITIAITEIASVFPQNDVRDPLSGLSAWQDQSGLPRLSAYGVERQDFTDLATRAIAASSSRKNAVPLTPDDFMAILEEAY